MKRTILALWLVILFAAYAKAATYWVSKSSTGDGNACNNSSTPLSTTAKLTIAGGLKCLSSGDTLNIRSGTYDEAITQSNFSVGQSGRGSGNKYTNPTTIQGSPGEAKPVLGTGRGNNGGCAGFGTPNTGQSYQYIIFKNFICDGQNDAWNGPGIGGGGNGGSVHHIKFDGIEVRNYMLTAMFLGGDDNAAHDLWIVNGYLHDNGTPKGLRDGNGPGTGYAYGHCWYVETSNNIIENSRCINQAAYGIQIYPNNSQTGNIFRNLWIENAGMGDGRTAFGIGIVYGSNTQVYNNVIINSQNGLEIHGNNQKIYSNTVYGNGIGHGGVCCYEAVMANNATNTSIRNNIVIGNRINTILIGGRGMTQDHNVTRGSTSSIFVNPGSGDFRLKTGSPAIDAGAALGSPYNIDYAGLTRPQPAGGAWDAGAYGKQRLESSGGVGAPP
jgi:hypothetical protein